VKRRAFLATMAAAPWFVRRAFGDASVGGVGKIAAGHGDGASATTRPTLVLVVPRDESARWSRGVQFGELLNHGSDRELAPLALVDVVCAPASAYGLADEPLMLYVVGSTVHRLGSAKELRQMIPLPTGTSVAELAAAARARYVIKHAPRGSRWGNTGVCGVTYEEGPQPEMPDCGMARAPEASRRFLDFYVKRS